MEVADEPIVNTRPPLLLNTFHKRPMDGPSVTVALRPRARARTGAVWPGPREEWLAGCQHALAAVGKFLRAACVCVCVCVFLRAALITNPGRRPSPALE